jgi:hypothetical protein
LEIPGEVAEAVHLSDLEKIQLLRLELAVSLYAQCLLGLGKAVQLAELSRWVMNACWRLGMCPCITVWRHFQRIVSMVVVNVASSLIKDPGP